MPTETEILLRYLRDLRGAFLWKVDGLDEYDLRRPLTPTGTNLLGIVKHVASVELGYFSEPCGRDQPVPTPWIGPDMGFEEDMFATADQSSQEVLELYRAAGENTEAAIAELDLDAPVTVPWWSEDKRNTTLRQLTIHIIAETARHLGHVDILREQIDGKAGMLERAGNLPEADDGAWALYRAKLQSIADSFRSS
ncbi:DinB family protein [Nesterenkonia muleiensis]|uniref:DinB family protein n=1 Tax=Nesterenkonia muleiensis TaxID=2282648 RepID=UPI000E72DD86|nr:DinB family protein [Nesterenkonia muleiensis]